MSSSGLHRLVKFQNSLNRKMKFILKKRQFLPLELLRITKISYNFADIAAQSDNSTLDLEIYNINININIL